MPKVHNRETPVANQPVSQRAQQGLHERHLKSLTRIGSRVSTRWGEKWNGFRDQKQPYYPHVRSNLKRAQMQDERFTAIELENNVLLAKLGKILRRSHNPLIGTRDWMGGMRLTENQVPVIDHWISRDTTQFGAAVEPSSLNLGLRKLRREQIEVENRALVARLQACRPTYDREQFEAHARSRDQWMHTHGKEPRMLSPILGYGRPQSADEQGESSSLPGVPPRMSQSAGGFGKQPTRGGGGKQKQSLRKQVSPIDPSLLKVLDLLSSHMKGAAGSLADMRVARDTLMEGVCPLGDDIALAVVQEGGVEFEVVAAPNVRQDCKSVLVFVHGGMFVTGSPRAVRHLAARLSADTGIPVVTPTLRVAPEHPYPAAFDDLYAAYSLLQAKGVSVGSRVESYGDGAARFAAMTGAPESIVMFAESSGAALALGTLTRLRDAGQALPQGLVMASPWLDMTCSGNSFVANEKLDLVMQARGNMRMRGGGGTI